MLMPGRHFSAETGYRYGFNGKENDNEVKGEGNQVAYENRIYDPRLGRWYSLDPLQKKYPNESNYCFVSNNPIIYLDKDGRDKIYSLTIIHKDGTVKVYKWRAKDFFVYSHVPISGYGNDRYFKQDVYVNATIDLKNQHLDYAEELGRPIQIPAIFYGFNTLIEKLNKKTAIRGSQPSGINFTSSFAIEIDGPKTDVKGDNPATFNIDALLAAAGAASKSGEALTFRIDELSEWVNQGKEIYSAFQDTKESFETNESQDVEVTETSQGKWDFYIRDKNGKLKEAQRTEAEPPVKKKGKNGAPDTIYRKVYSRPPTPKKDIPKKKSNP